MNILNNHSDYNKWQVYSGTKIANDKSVSSYVSLKGYTRQLKEQIGEYVRALIVEYVNENKNRGTKMIVIKDIDHMIDNLNSATNKHLAIFKRYYERDIFQAFKFLHKITY